MPGRRSATSSCRRRRRCRASTAHSEFARLNGATDAEIKEAIAMGSLTRELSTMLNGLQVDETQFHHDIDRIVKGAKAAAAKASQKKNPATAQR